MNTATKNLEDDHVYILLLTDVMEQIVQSNDPDLESIEEIVDIIKNFADGLHHAKEEEHFFPFLEGIGFSTTQGPVAVMLHEHEQGRNFVRGIVDDISAYKNGNKDAKSGIYMNMTGYANLLRNHISKENNILFRMADRVLSETDNAELSNRFSEAEKSCGSCSGDYKNKIQEMASIHIS
jgi:hemerythrin-like domain-containing protein